MENKSTKKMTAATYAILIKLLADGTRTCAELAEATGLHIVTIYNYVQHLHKAKVIHICMWKGTGRQQTRIYMLGDKADAPRPSKTRKQIAADYRARKHEEAND